MIDYPKADEDFVKRVEDYMQSHRGYNNRVTRATLSYEFQSHDRKIRDALSKIDGIVHQDKGYFLPQSEEEALPYINSLRSRIKSLRERLVGLEAYLVKVQEPQKAEQLNLLELDQ
jgi:predicted  nucleic acid-binding Zn-ribbon protein